MKKTLLGYFLLVVMSCDTSVDKKTQVILANNLGIIELNLPEEYNEVQKTFKNSDCGCCCDQIWNIFYSSEKDDLPKEDTLPYFTGIDYQSTPGYRLTISQPSCSDCFDDIEINLHEHLKKTIKMLKDENPSRELSDYNLMEIFDQPFMVIKTLDTSDGFVHEEVCATTYVKGQPIDLTFFRNGTNSSDFIIESIEIVKTISIK